MTTYAVIQTGGKQYRVHPGDSLKVELLNAEEGSIVELEDVRLVSQPGKLDVGKPIVPGAKVITEGESHGKHDKIVVMKYKRKTRYQVKRGHRQKYTQLRVKDIKLEGAGNGS